MREGFGVVHVDVADRPRRHGKSNYGILDRGLRGALDLIGVWWLRRRRKIVPDDYRDPAMTEIFGPLAGWLHTVFVEQFDAWILLGFVAQALFTMRFVVQWVASERAKRSVVPVAFWFFSLGGGALLFIYAIVRQDPVFILGQGLGLFIYIRNLWLIANERKAANGTS